MPSRRTRAKPRNASQSSPPPPAPRKPDGTFQKGYSGQPGGDAGRARRALNLDTIREMHLAFQKGGRAAITKVMTQQPAIFLKLLVLLVPRELEVTTTRGIKGMTDEQLEASITAIEQYLARRGKRAGDDAKLIEGQVADDPSSTPR